MKKICYFTVVAVVVMTIARAQAATYTWTENTTGSHDWFNAANWNSNGVFSSGSGNELRFDFGKMPNGAFATLTNVPAALSMNTLTLDGAGPNNSAGADFVIGDNSSTWTIGDAGTSTVSLATTRGGGSNDRIIRWSVEPNIVLNRALTTFAGNGTFYRRTLMFKGNVTEAGAGYSVTKSGSTWLGFYGTNTYSGTTTINEGVLRLGSAFALPGGIGVSGGTSALTISNGVVDLGATDLQRNLGTGSDQFLITGGSSGFGAAGSHRFVKVNGDAVQELVWGGASFAPSVLVVNKSDSSDNNLTLFNKIDLSASTRTIEVNAYTAAFPGDIRTSSGTAGLTKTGDGTLVLSGANTYNDDTIISAGTLSVGVANNLGNGSAGLVFNGGTFEITGTTLTNVSGLGRTVTFNANKTAGFNIDASDNTFTVDQALNQGSGGLGKYGAGALLISSCSFSGATEIYGGGKLVLDYSSDNSSKLSDSSALTLGGGALELRGGTHSEVVGSTTISKHAGNFLTRVSGAATVNLNVINRSASLSSLSFSEDGMATTDNNNNSIGILGGWATVGSHLAVNSTDGADGPISAYSAYTPFVTSGGSLDTNYQLIGSNTFTSSASMGTLRIENDADDQVLNLQNYTLTIDNYNRGNNGVLLYAGGANNNYTIAGTGGLTCRNGSGQYLGINTYTGTLTLDARFGMSGSGLVKTGAGTFVINGASSYTGGTLLHQGVTRLANDSALGNSSSITIQSGAALELSNNISVASSTMTLSGAGPAGGGALRNISGNNIYSGAITVTESTTRINSDSGNLTLTGNITALSVDLTLGSRSESIVFGGAGNIVVSNAAVNVLAIIKDGAGTLGIVVGNSDTTQWNCGGMTLNDSTLQFIFNGAPSETEPVIKVVGDLNFSGTPTIEIVIDEADITAGVRYPLIEVVGSAPATKPTLVGSTAALKWGGSGNSTLYLDTSPSGSVLIVR